MISQLFVGYHVTDRIGFQFTLPVIHRSFLRPEGGGIERGSESGVGDVSLIGSFLALRHDGELWTAHWSLHAGVKLPSGGTDRLREELAEAGPPEGVGEENFRSPVGHTAVGLLHGEEDHDENSAASGIHGHDLTLGSGSVDGLIGTSFLLRWKRAMLTGSLQYAVRSEGDFDYRFANDLVWAGGPGCYVAMNHNSTVALQAIVSGEYKGLDTLQRVKMGDTGLTAVYLGPQLSVTWRSHLSADVGVDLPVSLDNSAVQAVPDYRVRGGFSWRF